MYSLVQGDQLQSFIFVYVEPVKRGQSQDPLFRKARFLHFSRREHDDNNHDAYLFTDLNYGRLLHVPSSSSMLHSYQ